MSLSVWETELAELDAAHGTPAPVRVAYAAAHLCIEAGSEATIDWEATEQQRSFLDGHGFGAAEAMDTAQRFEIGWPFAKELIERTAELPLTHGFTAGASADHADVDSLADLAAAVAWQVDFIRGLGGLPVILPMPQLAERGCGEEEYVEVYRAILAASEGPVLLHWLGPMFLPGLDAYFPGNSFQRIMEEGGERIVGVKLSLLDAEFERQTRQRIAAWGQQVYTGDDFNFASLIAGDGEGVGEHSHALLGILDGIARPAGLAFRFLAHGQKKRFLEIMQPCEALSRAIFETPTQHYKAGLAWLAWLDGRQPNSELPFAAHTRRNPMHFERIFTLALQAEVFSDSSAAQARAALSG